MSDLISKNEEELIKKLSNTNTINATADLLLDTLKKKRSC